MSEFEKMSVKELQNFAKENGLKGFTGLKKQELITFIIKEAMAARKASSNTASIS